MDESVGEDNFASCLASGVFFAGNAYLDKSIVPFFPATSILGLGSVFFATTSGLPYELECSLIEVVGVIP